MNKLVRITDIKPMEIFIGRKTRGPITMRMNNETIRRLLNQLDGPKGIYAVSEDGKSVKLTNKNYTLSEQELFADKSDKNEPQKEIETKDYKESAPKVDPNLIESKKETTDKLDSIGASLQNLKTEVNKENNSDAESKDDSLKESLQDIKTSDIIKDSDNKPKNNYNNKK